MTDQDLYDAIIVGAGPGGATAAYFLGEAGWRVLLLEKESVPRYKTCGGGLSAGMLEIFPFPFEPVIEARVESIAFALRQRRVEIPIPGLGMQMVMRDRFDAYVLAHAKVEVCTGTAVQRVVESDDGVIVETRDRRAYRGRYLIAADGANSVAARSLGLRRGKRLAGAIEVEAEAPPEVLARFAGRVLFIFGELDMGYLWVFPKAHHLSVGIAALGPKPGELQAALQRVMSRLGIPLHGAERHGHPIPVYTGREPLRTRRTLLVGDAAGLVDPFSGEGIRFAVKSGKLAAEVLLAGRLEAYESRVRREIGASHAWGAWLARLFYHFPRACFTLGVRNPFVTFAFAEMLADRTTYPPVVIKIFATLPLFVLTELAARLAGPQLGRRLRAAVYPAVPVSE
jgi:geranylgeranyl reductase family protein